MGWFQFAKRFFIIHKLSQFSACVISDTNKYFDLDATNISKFIVPMWLCHHTTSLYYVIILRHHNAAGTVREMCNEQCNQYDMTCKLKMDGRSWSPKLICVPVQFKFVFEIRHSAECDVMNNAMQYHMNSNLSNLILDRS